MTANSFSVRLLRFVGILLMALTAGFTLLGGAGTSCAAFNPAGFGASMAKLAPLQWLYIVYVLIGILLGVAGVAVTVRLVRGSARAYREALLVLIAGAAVGILHIATSRALRGSSMPVDAVVYATVLTLVYFLILRIPAIWKGVDFARGSSGSNASAGGVAAILLGILALSIQHWMAPTHTWGGVNYADAFRVTMAVFGAAGVLAGSVTLALPFLRAKAPAPATDREEARTAA